MRREDVGDGADDPPLATRDPRLTRTARRWTLHLPARWPWQRSFIEALTKIRALPAVV